MNIGIPPPRGKTKYFGQLITVTKTQSKSSPTAASNARGQHPRATGVDVTETPTERQTPQLFDATVTPSPFYAFGTWTMTEEEEGTPDNTTTDECYHTDEEKRTNPAAAHAANVNDVADEEPTTPTATMRTFRQTGKGNLGNKRCEDA